MVVMEDSDDDALLIIDRLRRGGLDVSYDRVDTTDGATAVLRDHPPDLVICDYHMPALSAEQGLAHLRDSGLDVPFILVSGQVGEETAAALMRAGAADFLLKDRLSRLVPAVQRELREAADRRKRRQAEAALRRSEEQFRLLAEQASDTLFRLRLLPRPEVEYLSPAVALITGCPPQALCGSPETLFSLVDEDDRAGLEESWRSSAPEPLTVRWHRPDGRTVWTDQRVVGVHDEQGRLVAVQGILRDVTDQVEAARERERLEQQLRLTERMESLGRLAGGVAHDFNNLLSVIIGCADMVTETLPADDVRRPDMTGIRDAAERAARLTRQLLTFSRKEPTRAEILDLNAAVTDTESMLRRTIGEDIEFVTRQEPALDPITIDPSGIEQVLLNLIVNSRGAMPDGGRITITTANVHGGECQPLGVHPPSGRWACLTVTDTGCGMSPEVAQRALEPFFTTKGPGQGTGLGLATVYGVVKAAGGEVDIHSEVGTGTSIRVFFPATTAAESAPAAASDDDDRPGSGGETILVVEDEEAVRAIATRILTRAGYEVHQAASPAEALDRFGAPEMRIDALLTDSVMPGMSGDQLVEEFHRTRPELPAMVMSGYAGGLAAPGGPAPADIPRLDKPFTARTLLEKLRDLLRGP